MNRNILHLPLLFVLAALVTIGSGCGPSARTQQARANDRENSVQSYDYTDDAYDDDDRYEEEPRSERNQARRQVQHRQSLRNMGQWLIAALIGIGINVLIAVLFWA